MKKLISVLLAAVLLFCCLSSVSAGAVYVENNHFETVYPELFELKGDGNNYPTIILPGINHSPYFLADKDGNAVLDSSGNALTSTLLLLDRTLLKKDATSLVPRLLASLLLQRDIGATEGISKLIYDLMDYMEMRPDGTTVNNLVTRRFDVPVSEMSRSDKSFFYSMLPVEPIAEVCGEENLFLYTFALFGDPMESAKGIDGFIDAVLEKTGAQKVNLAN